MVAVRTGRRVTRCGGPLTAPRDPGSAYGGEMPEAPDDPIAHEKVSVFDGILVLSATGTGFAEAESMGDRLGHFFGRQRR